ncbi:hypothetical protein [Ferruginibacter sp.]|nr:hypothetical protein [Ferruginibacter sp.]
MTQTEAHKLMYLQKNHLYLIRDRVQNKKHFTPKQSAVKTNCCKNNNILLVFFLLLIHSAAPAQTLSIDKKNFFSEEQPFEMSLTADVKKLFTEKLKKDYEELGVPASITCIFNDSIKLTEDVEVCTRGEFRREECGMPPLMINFKTSKPGTLKKLGKLKLVWPCEATNYNEQLILKEYLAYKIYNLITEKSFRVRLVKIEVHDSRGKYKPFNFFAFFIEDVDDMAKRNHCKEIELLKLNTEQTNREQATIVHLFQYMIGNTDWAVPLYRNIKLIQSKKDSLQAPFIVPYDFDYCGLVDADYAVPVPDLEITSVRERSYRGFARTMDELKAALQIFETKKTAIDSLISNFKLLHDKNKKEMLYYLEDFYDTIAKDKNIKYIFIDNIKRN